MFPIIDFMVCEHLHTLEHALMEAGIPETFRGQAWTKNCREWVYFHCKLNIELIRTTFELPSNILERINHDPRSGREHGLVCQTCHDAIMGRHPEDQVDVPFFPPFSEETMTFSAPIDDG